MWLWPSVKLVKLTLDFFRGISEAVCVRDEEVATPSSCIVPVPAAAISCSVAALCMYVCMYVCMYCMEGKVKARKSKKGEGKIHRQKDKWGTQ